MDGSIFEDSENARSRAGELIKAQMAENVHPENIQDALDTFAKLADDIRTESEVKNPMLSALSPNRPEITFQEYSDIAKTSYLEPAHAEMLYEVIMTLAEEREHSADERSHIFSDISFGLQRLQQDFRRAPEEFKRQVYTNGEDGQQNTPGF